ncbi:MAG: hypothetical protein QOK43_1250 [Acidimicrobiaceae bacterium]|nr:hypothetical protein [Acidimicrobiaceae bacterium]
MAETSFSIVFDGPSLDSGRMDVHDLAPALLALGDLMREANALINPDGPPVSLELRATATGSVEVALSLTAPDFIHRVIDMFSGDPATALANLKELVIGTGVGLFLVIKKLHNRRIARQERLQSGWVRLVFDDGEVFEVPENALRLYGSNQIRRRVRQVLEPLHRDGIERVDFVDNGQTTTSIYKSEADEYEPPPSRETMLVEQDTVMALTIASPSFTEGNKWRLSDGERTFYASVEDQGFLDRVDRGLESFRKGDIMRCDVHFRQWQTETGLRPEYVVTRVAEHIQGAVPQVLFDQDSPPAEDSAD